MTLRKNSGIDVGSWDLSCHQYCVMTSEIFSDCPRAKLHLSLHFVNALHLSRDYMHVLTFHLNFLIYLQTMLLQGKFIFPPQWRGGIDRSIIFSSFRKRGYLWHTWKRISTKHSLKSFKTVLTVNFALQLYKSYSTHM